MSDTLSRDEVDALLKGMAEGEVPMADAAAEAGAVRSFDLLGTDRVVGAQIPGLDLIHDRFARELPAALEAIVGAPPTVERAELEVQTFRTLCHRLVPGTALCLFTLAPLRGHGLLSLPPALVYEMVDRMFGGTGRLPQSLEGRACSAIELRTVGRIAARMLGALTAGFAPLLPVSCAFERTELDLDLASIAAPEEMTASLELRCSFGNGEAAVAVALPHGTLEPLRAKLGERQGTTQGTDREWLGAMRAAVCQSDVLVTAELGCRDMAAREVLQLRVGDLLALETRGEDPLVVRVEGQRVARGLAGISRGQNAVRILGFDAGE